jgi:hypothetical protein
MKYFRSLFVMTVAAVGSMAAIPAFAIGTAAGTTVTNAVTLDYQVSGFAQTQQTASVQFVVDRAIATLVVASGASAVQVTPGQTSASQTLYPALNFDVSNTGNDLQDVWLALIDRGATNVTGLAGQGAGAAFVDPTPIVAIDTNTNGLFDSGVDTVLTATGGHYVLSGMARDTTQRILVVVNVPTAALNGARDAFTLVAGVAIAGGGAFISGDTNGHNSPGGTSTNDLDVIGTAQNVFADVSPSAVEDVTWNFLGNVVAGQDGLYNGQHADTNAFVVRAAQLYVGKTVQVLWDPVNGNRYSANNSDTVTTANPKAIPGAVVMYAVGVQNDTGSPNATGISINDDLQNGGEIVVGNPAGAPVFVPDHVSVTLNAVSVSLDVPNSPNMAQVSQSNCAGAVSTTPFNGTNPEVTTTLGTCTATQTGVIVYFVTLQ